MFTSQVLCSPSVRSVRSLHCFSMFSATLSRILLWSEMYIKCRVLLPKYQLILRVFPSLSLCVPPPSNLSSLTLSRRAVQLRESEDFNSFKNAFDLTSFLLDYHRRLFPFDTAFPFLDRDLLNHPLSIRSNLTSLAFSHARPTTSLHLAAPVRLAKSSFLTLSPTFHI